MKDHTRLTTAVSGRPKGRFSFCAMLGCARTAPDFGRVESKMPLTSQLRSHHELHELRERVQPHLYRWRYLGTGDTSQVPGAIAGASSAERRSFGLDLVRQPALRHELPGDT